MLVRMSLSPNVRDLLDGHISLELESIDRLYLNGYVPQLQHGAGLVGFLCQQRGQPTRPSGTGDPFLFLRTGAEAPAYSRSASPRRRRFYSPAIPPRVQSTGRVSLKAFPTKQRSVA